MTRKFQKCSVIFIAIVFCMTLFAPAAFAKGKAPTAPANIKAAVQSCSAIKISWDKVVGASGYEIYRATSLTGSYRRIVSTSVVSYTNKGLSDSKTYYYKVRAYTKSGGKKVYSGDSSIVKATTPKNLMAYYKSIQGSSLSKAKQKKLDAKVSSIISSIIKPDMTELEKANAIYNYILDNVKYEPRGWQINNANHAYGALVVGRAQCSGYSRAFTLLCAQVGIETRYVIYKNSSESGHKWNMIKIGGQFYHLDLQGVDSMHDDPPDFGPGVDLHLEDITYHLIGDANMDKDTYKWDKKKYPKCPESYQTCNR